MLMLMNGLVVKKVLVLNMLKTESFKIGVGQENSAGTVLEVTLLANVTRRSLTVWRLTLASVK